MRRNGEEGRDFLWLHFPSHQTSSGSRKTGLWHFFIAVQSSTGCLEVFPLVLLQRDFPSPFFFLKTAFIERSGIILLPASGFLAIGYLLILLARRTQLNLWSAFIFPFDKISGVCSLWTIPSTLLCPCTPSARMGPILEFLFVQVGCNIGSLCWQLVC